MRIQVLAIAAAVALVATIAGAQSAAKQKSLYDRLGGRQAITAVVRGIILIP